MIKFVGYVLFAESLCQSSDAPVVVSIFESLRYRFAFAVRRDESIFFVAAHTKLIFVSAFHHSFQSLLVVDAFKSAEVSISDDRYRVITKNNSAWVAIKNMASSLPTVKENRYRKLSNMPTMTGASLAWQRLSANKT